MELIVQIAEVFGYAGDRTVALNTLMSSGGWSTSSDTPAHDERDEGLRRPVCDLILLAFHLVISLLMYVFPVPTLGKAVQVKRTRTYGSEEAEGLGY